MDGFMAFGKNCPKVYVEANAGVGFDGARKQR